MTNEVTHERTLGAQRESVARVFDVRAYDEASVRRDGAGADRDVRVRRVGRRRGVSGPFAQFIPRDLRR